ncbi:MAG: 4Fe-4S binding protein, partial [Thermodesulfobacteriota bacterium]|nr:4Fe-4S binding protein [Thermodesulfobacteriota bacterium]
MNVTRLRWAILVLSFLILTFGGLIGIYIGDFLPTFACAFVGGEKVGGICFLYPLQAALESAKLKEYLSIFVTFFFFSLLIIILGRFWCGWICPLGFIQDVLDLIRKKLHIDYIRFSHRLREGLKSIKWVFLFVALLIPLWVAFPFFAPDVARDMRMPFCSLCPARYILPMVSGDYLRVGIDLRSATAITMSLLGVIFSALTILLALLKRRFFCSYCPMVLFISFYKQISLVKLRKDIPKCTRCEICYHV